jgi:hypothetical protein
MPTYAEDGADRSDQPHGVGAGAAAFAPTRVDASTRWLGPAIGALVAVVGFGFGSSLAARTTIRTAADTSAVAVTVPTVEPDGNRERSILLQARGRSPIANVAISIGVRRLLQVDAVVDGAVTSVQIRASDRAGHVLATATVSTHALPSVLASSPSGNGVAVISATLVVPPAVDVDEVVVDLIEP